MASTRLKLGSAILHSKLSKFKNPKYHIQNWKLQTGCGSAVAHAYVKNSLQSTKKVKEKMHTYLSVKILYNSCSWMFCPWWKQGGGGSVINWRQSGEAGWDKWPTSANTTILWLDSTSPGRHLLTIGHELLDIRKAPLHYQESMTGSNGLQPTSLNCRGHWLLSFQREPHAIGPAGLARTRCANGLQQTTPPFPD